MRRLHQRYQAACERWSTTRPTSLRAIQRKGRKTPQYQHLRGSICAAPRTNINKALWPDGNALPQVPRIGRCRHHNSEQGSSNRHVNHVLRHPPAKAYAGVKAFSDNVDHLILHDHMPCRTCGENAKHGPATYPDADRLVKMRRTVPSFTNRRWR